MDFVTHAAVGALVGRLVAPPGSEPRTARRAALVGALVAVAPDADHVLEWISAEAYLLNHRTATHSIPVLAAALLPVALWGGPGRARRTVLAALALASHLLLDVLTPFGTGLLWPFSDRMFTLDVLPIVCPWLTALCLVAAVFGAAGTKPGQRTPRRAAGYGLTVVALFVALEAVVVARARSESVRPLFCVPSWKWPLDAVLLEDGGPGRDAGFVSMWTVRIDGHPERELVTARLTVAVPREEPPSDRGRGGSERWTERVVAEVRLLESRSDVARLVGRFRVPAVEVDEDLVRWTDLQYDVIEPGIRPLEVSVRSGGPPQVRQMELGVQPLLYLAVLALAFAISRRPMDWR